LILFPIQDGKITVTWDALLVIICCAVVLLSNGTYGYILLGLWLSNMMYKIYLATK